VQPFVYLEDVRQFVTAQFQDYKSLKSQIDMLKAAPGGSAGGKS